MLWKKIRTTVMFTIACIASPCCTPLIVPLALSIIAGTPAALWISQNVGWVYGGLTLISIISLVLGLRWLRQKSTPSQPLIKQIPIMPEAAQPMTRK